MRLLTEDKQQEIGESVARLETRHGDSCLGTKGRWQWLTALFWEEEIGGTVAVALEQDLLGGRLGTSDW